MMTKQFKNIIAAISFANGIVDVYSLKINSAIRPDAVTHQPGEVANPTSVCGPKAGGLRGGSKPSKCSPWCWEFLTCMAACTPIPEFLAGYVSHLEGAN